MFYLSNNLKNIMANGESLGNKFANSGILRCLVEIARKYTAYNYSEKIDSSFAWL